jgi:hypothetical protein
MVAYELLTILKENGFFVIGYADDFVILVRGRFCSTVFERMQVAADIVEDCCRKVALSVNSSETNLILFTSKRKIGSHPKKTFSFFVSDWF